ncbi:hypothetical protein ACJJI5_19020 [Microbulbifer sp. EKSA008]|uniref:hypothetical protein n=1 Tax=unclassified Microbulbifer TaxID=2619833 RepID=UPI002B2C9414|nr:hypothetical protein QT397_08625 [Microbulbifer sp. MKSA007]
MKWILFHFCLSGREREQEPANVFLLLFWYFCANADEKIVLNSSSFHRIGA